MSAADFLLCAVATWRLAYLLVNEDGPWQVVARFRARTTLGGLLTCVYCATLWTAVGMLVLWGWGGVARAFVAVLALSGAGLMLASFSGTDRG